MMNVSSSPNSGVTVVSSVMLGHPRFAQSATDLGHAEREKRKRAGLTSGPHK
jgi:hypothetical protein